MKEYFNDEDERLGPPKKGKQRPIPTVKLSNTKGKFYSLISIDSPLRDVPSK